MVNKVGRMHHSVNRGDPGESVEGFTWGEKSKEPRL